MDVTNSISNKFQIFINRFLCFILNIHHWSDKVSHHKISASTQKRQTSSNNRSVEENVDVLTQETISHNHAHVIHFIEFHKEMLDVQE